jgi:hypothetical protein
MFLRDSRNTDYFLNPQSLEYDVRLRSELVSDKTDLSYKCNHCSLLFSQENNLEQHKKAVECHQLPHVKINYQNYGQLYFRCEMCKKEYKRLELLKHQVRTHKSQQGLEFTEISRKEFNERAEYRRMEKMKKMKEIGARNDISTWTSWSSSKDKYHET